MCGKTGHFAFYAPLDPLSVLHPQIIVPPYSLGICPPTTPETLWSPIAPSSRKNWFSEGIFFWQSTQTALESPKIDICQNWPRRVLEDVIWCLESKFDKKNPMGSVPNCRKEIPMCHAIRWFECKLKPPKNESNMKVTKIVQKHFLCTFWGFLVTIICDVKIDTNMCEPHYVNLFFLWTSSIVHVFDFLTFDIFLTTWHLFDNLTSFLTYG